MDKNRTLELSSGPFISKEHKTDNELTITEKSRLGKCSEKKQSPHFEEEDNKDSFYSQIVDIDMLRQVGNGDQQAYEKLYLRYWPYLLRFIHRQRPLLDEHIAEDVVSEALAKIWYERSRLSEVRNFLAYLKAVAINIISRRFRNHNCNEVQVSVDAVEAAMSPQDALERDELSQQVAQTIDALFISHRLALEASQSGLSAREIAVRLGCTENAARRRVQKARKSLARALSRCGDYCAIDHGNPDKCPAKTENLYCLKFIYSK